MKLRFIVLGVLIAFSTTNFAQTVAASKKSLPIGVFDSGTGGLTVLEAMLKLDFYNNATGLPGADGKPDFSKEYFEYLA